MAPPIQDFPAWPLRPQSALRRSHSGKNVSGAALPPRPRSAVSHAQAGRPRLRLGNRGGHMIPPPYHQKGTLKGLTLSHRAGEAPAPMPLPQHRDRDGTIALAQQCCERVRSNSNASASTRDTERGGETAPDVGCTLPSFGSLAPSHEHDSTDGLEAMNIAPPTGSRGLERPQSAAATREPTYTDKLAEKLAARAHAEKMAEKQRSWEAEKLASQQVQTTVSPTAAAAHAAADAECQANGPQYTKLIPVPSSPSSGAPPPAQQTRPSSAHPTRPSTADRARLPLSSIAFAAQATRPSTAHPGQRSPQEALHTALLTQATRPSTAHPGTRVSSQEQQAQQRCAEGRDPEFVGNRQTMQLQAAQAGLGTRSKSASALRGHSQLQEGLVGGKYQTLHYLGRGTSASVWEAVDEGTREHVAIKVFDKHKGNWASRQKQAVREARLLQALKHPTIVKVFDTCDAPFKFHIVMELVVGGSLRQLLAEQPTPGLGEVTSRALFEQICDGVDYCHARNIVHRDLKLENILVNSGQGTAKLIDFGFAVQLRSPDQRLRVFCGTPSYMAPELVMGKEYSGFSTDMWAMGVVLFGMLTGHMPFQGQTESQLYAKIRRGSFRFPDSVAEMPRRIITAILRIDAGSRPSVSSVLQHRWVRPNYWDSAAENGPKWSNTTSKIEPGKRPSSVPASMRRLRTVRPEII